MSDVGGAAPRAWHFFVDDMIEFVQTAQSYTENFEQSSFEKNRLVFDATVRNLELLGEAARNVPEDARQLAPNIPWRQIIATRNRLTHDYLGIDTDTLWSIIRDDLPSLFVQLKAFKATIITNKGSTS